MSNDQHLLFDQNSFLTSEKAGFLNSETFAYKGYSLFRGIKDSIAAESLSSAFLGALNDQLQTHLSLFQGQLKLAKKDRIPSRHCQDAVRAESVSLHFDMGLPLLPTDEAANIYVFTCLYFPADLPAATAQTRLFDTRGLFSKISPAVLQQRLVHYTGQYGTGYGEYVFGRLSCLGQLLEAGYGKSELAFMREHRIAEWFNRGPEGEALLGESVERAFFEKFGIHLPTHERVLHLGPGDLLIIDNLRLAHGRRGPRAQEELYQLLYGVEQVGAEKIAELRTRLVELWTAPTA